MINAPPLHLHRWQRAPSTGALFEVSNCLFGFSPLPAFITFAVVLFQVWLRRLFFAIFAGADLNPYAYIFFFGLECAGIGVLIWPAHTLSGKFDFLERERGGRGTRVSGDGREDCELWNHRGWIDGKRAPPESVPSPDPKRCRCLHRWSPPSLPTTRSWFSHFL